MGPPYGKLLILQVFPYHSHIFRDSFGIIQSIYPIFIPVFEGDPFFQRSFGQPKLVIKTLTGTATRWRARCKDQNGSRGGKERPSWLLVVGCWLLLMLMMMMMMMMLLLLLLLVACWLLVVAYRLLVVVAVACWLLVVDDGNRHLFFNDPQGGCRPLNLRLWCELLDSRSFFKECVDGNPRSWGKTKIWKNLEVGISLSPFSAILHQLYVRRLVTMFCFFFGGKTETFTVVLEGSSWLDRTVLT